MAAASLDAAAGEAFTSEAAIRRAERRDDILRTSLRIASLNVWVGRSWLIRVAYVPSDDGIQRILFYEDRVRRVLVNIRI